MKLLNKKQKQERDRLVSELSVKREQLQEAVDDYNELLEAAREWRDDIVGLIEDYISERSDKWHESDAAQQTNDWLYRFSELNLDDLDMDEIGAEHADQIEDIPEERES